MMLLDPDAFMEGGTGMQLDKFTDFQVVNDSILAVLPEKKGLYTSILIQNQLFL